MVWESSRSVRCAIPKLDRTSWVKAPQGKDAGVEIPTVKNREHALESVSTLGTSALMGETCRGSCSGQLGASVWYATRTNLLRS